MGCFDKLPDGQPAGVPSDEEPRYPVWTEPSVFHPLRAKHGIGNAGMHDEEIESGAVASRELRGENYSTDDAQPLGLRKGLRSHVPIATGNPWPLERVESHRGMLEY